jgi:hypothetical protein
MFSQVFLLKELQNNENLPHRKTLVGAQHQDNTLKG